MGSPLEMNGIPPIDKSEIGDLTAISKNNEKSFAANETINGINIICEWDKDYHCYVLYLPQIEPSEETRGKGITDQLLHISNDPEDDPEQAKIIFDYAKGLAESGKYDVYEIYRRTGFKIARSPSSKFL